MVSPTELNRIKIKDMVANLKADLNPDNALHLIQIRLLDMMIRGRIESGSDEDVKKMEEWFIERKLGIKYYPEQGRKVIRGEVVPIDQIYGPEND